MLQAIRASEYRYQCVAPMVFHAGDGNPAPLIMYDANVPG